MIDAEDIVEKSYQEMVKPISILVDGLDHKEYIALLMFVDAFADIVLNEYPSIADKVVKPAKDLMDTVPAFFDEKDLDVMDYVDLGLADKLINSANKFFNGKITVSDLIKFDKEALGHLILVAIGHKENLKDIPRLKKFLQTNGVESPTAKDLGLDLDQNRYKSAYKALKDMNILKESKEISKYLERAIGEIERAQRSTLNKRTKHRLQEILYQLDAVSHG